MRFRQNLVGWIALTLVGCAVGTTDDFFKVSTLPEDAEAGEDGSGGAESASSGGAANASSANDGNATTSPLVASINDSGSPSSTVGSTSTTGQGGEGGSGGTGPATTTTGTTSDAAGGSSGSSGSAGNGGDAGSGSVGGAGTGGSAATGGSGGSGAVDEPITTLIEFEADDDCVALECPEEAPYVVACELEFTSALETYHCVAVETEGVVFIRSGTSCATFGSNVAEGSNITCSSAPLEGDLSSDECVAQGEVLDLVSDRCDCQASYTIDGCF